MGEIVVTGPQATQYLSYVTTNDISALSDGEAQYSLLLNDNGTVIDDIIVYRVTTNDYLIVVNASRQSEDFSRFKELSVNFDRSCSYPEMKSDAQIAVLIDLSRPASQMVLAAAN